MSGVQSISCLLADVGSGTCASGSFPLISHACLSLLSNRFASDPKHVAAVISYGSENTHNALAEASEAGAAYAHVEVLRGFLPIDWQLLTELGAALRPGGKPSDPLDACIVATDLYEKAFAKQIAANKVECCFYLFSGPQSFVEDGDAAAVRQHMTSLGVRVIRIIAGARLASGGGAGFFDHEVCLPDFSSLTRLSVPVRAKRVVTKCRIPFSLSPSVKVSVFVYILAKREPLPSLRRHLKVPGFQGAKGVSYVAVATERFLYRADDPERRPVTTAAAAKWQGDTQMETQVGASAFPARDSDEVAFAFPLGKQLVPISAFEKEAHFALKTEKGLVLTGMLPLASVRRWWCIGQSELVVAAEGDSLGCTAMASLFWACVSLRCALLCRYTPRANSLPRPALLVPRLCSQGSWGEGQGEAEEILQSMLAGRQEVQQGFCLVHLPFADDVASVSFPLPPTSQAKEVRAMERLIDSRLLLKPSPAVSSQQQHCKDKVICRQLHPLCAPLSAYPAAEGPPFTSPSCPTFLPQSARSFGEQRSSFDPMNVPNPSMQRFLRLLTEKILAVAAPKQQQQQQQKLKQQGGGYEELLRAIDELFDAPVASTETETAAAAAGSRHPDDPVAALAALFPLVAEGPLKDIAAAAVAAKGAAAEALTKEFVRKEEVLRLGDVRLQQQPQVKPDVDTPQEEASQQQQQQQQEQQQQQYAVRSLNPVKDFEEMLQVREADLTDRAVAEMQQIIFDLLQRAQDQWTTAAAAGAAAPEQKQQYEQVYDGLASRYLTKAMMCLEALRDGCVRELEGKAFNAFLRQLQQRAAAAAAATDSGVYAARTGTKLFWDLLLAKRKIPLVTTEEDPHADVAPEDAQSIYTLQQQPQQLQQQPQLLQQQHPIDDILNLIE